MPRLGGPKMWDHVNRPPVGLSLLFQYHSCQGPCTRWHSLSPREKMFQFSLGEKKKKNQTQDTGALAGFSSDKPPERRKRRGFQKKKKPALFNCGTSIKASKWGRLGGTLAHQTDTPNTHHLYAGLLKKERSKFLKMKRGLFPAFIPPPTPIHPLPLFFFFFFTKLRKRGFGRHVKRT